LRSLLQPQNGIDEAAIKKRIIEVEERYQRRIDDLEATVKSLNNERIEVEKLCEENERLTEQAAKYGALEDLLRDIITPIIPQVPEASPISEEAIEAIVDRKIQRLSAGQRRSIASASDTGIPWVDMWVPKLGSAEKKIVRFLAGKFPLALTKSQIALGTGLTAAGGHFTGSLNNLVKWKLVERQGGTYKLAEAPA